jgi:3-keto-5-aminohexanoate cleavage enzyme
MDAMPLWDAAKKEMESYQFVASADVQPKWDVPAKIAINVAVSGRFEVDPATGKHLPMSIEDYVDEASQVIEAGACGVHIDFTWVTDKKGRRLDRDLPPAEAYGAVLEPLRARFGSDFVANLNVLNGTTFDICMSPARAGLAEVAPCAPGHPAAFMVPAIQTLEETGVKPELAVHSTGEIELAKRKLIDTGILRKPYYWIVLYGLPFDCGRTLISGTSVNDAQEMARHMFMMVDQIRKIDQTSVITVCAAGRATLYMTTLATMMGLNIRVGVEDTPWKHPNSDLKLKHNLEMFSMARDMAQLLGRVPGNADYYRNLLGLKRRDKVAAGKTGA